MKKILILLLMVFMSGCTTNTVVVCDDQDELVIATTTSTENSGLLDYILPNFEEENPCIDVQIIAVGTGAALDLGRAGDVDMLLVHATDKEIDFVEEGYGEIRSDVMFNDFILIGPSSMQANTLEEALEYIYSEGEAGNIGFYSRGDNSGTNIKELSLWAEYGYDVESFGDWYKETGKGMGDTIVMADESLFFTLSDRGTFINLEENLDLLISYSNPEALKNQYGIVKLNAEKFDINAEAANIFYDWLLSEETQNLIGSYTVKEEVLFFPNAK